MHQEALPLYLQIAGQLRRNIQEPVFKVGDRLPTETELSERFGVNRHTLRRAIEVLRQEGIVGVERGRGTFVMADPIAVPIGKRVRFNESLKAQSLQPLWQVLRIVEINADAKLSKRLEIVVGVAVILFERLSSIDDIPISIASSHFPGHHFPELVEHCETYRSISKMLQQEYDCDRIRRSTRLSARLAQANDARLLKMPANGPILLSESINVDQNGVVIEYGVTRFRGDRMELVLENQT
ncbi:phosphonate metabolism transcriptional regulator PhnF [Synechococcales cyanobacterium C]|uniref:Phosphonate metabolism transcriptional regulator PhnF n=1 Tax=Petrachloros mirabilis ULC683 TaxID=2781853 RepID=A0A8K2A764_9CYAN|nr:phosphonate metabolism transcriptional regulator PhnF [Petrachloros mirabilis]NCJ06561.1 phosphonate metabolism transcriptional regulator PhnF [Petrachloros mirabilis ULC683]